MPRLRLKVHGVHAGTAVDAGRYTCIPPELHSMTTTAADVLVETLSSWGIDTIFGIPGDGINGIMEALRKRADAIRFIQGRHEESAAFMACLELDYTRIG